MEAEIDCGMYCRFVSYSPEVSHYLSITFMGIECKIKYQRRGAAV